MSEMPVPQVSQTGGTPILSHRVPQQRGTAPDLGFHPTDQGVPDTTLWDSESDDKTAGQRVSQPVPPTGEGGTTPPAAHPSPSDGGPANRNKQADKDAAYRFRACINEERDHLRVYDGDRVSVVSLGTVRELHGPNGLCTCCHGRGTR